ncbi:hypothetical protein [Nostoc sp. LEGE 12450]|uniref:hypothetical protein n=1 Tax=Nostoc sp. LEGE 12450 TaxID=1828643 RepID=UPI00187E2104|nr:hypothetical protein [Nostoc sp. LEGE 12450]MBE8988419.1 hypothetical protein [Nostoc sp. LEGE 12450]
MSNPQKEQTRFFNDIYKPRTINLPFPYDNLDHGKKVLDNEAECDRYIGLYGGHHFHKLYEAFPSTKFENMEAKNIEIIDWGCGQALATCVLIDYFFENSFRPKIESVALIEPSAIALSRGYSFVCQMLQPNFSSNSTIKTVHKCIDNLNYSDFDSNPSNIKIHLFSNIIDVEYFEINKLYQLIINLFKGENRIICTSASRYTAISRIDNFYNLFIKNSTVIDSCKSSEAIFKEIFFNKNKRFEIGKIERYERQFTVRL